MKFRARIELKFVFCALSSTDVPQGANHPSGRLQMIMDKKPNINLTVNMNLKKKEKKR